MADRRDGSRPTFFPGAHGRRAADQIGWGIKIVRDLGFPIVVTWYLLTHLVPEIDKLLTREREVSRAQHAELITALTDQSEAIRAQTDALNAELEEMRRTNAIILDRANVMIRSARSKPTTIIVTPPGTVATQQGTTPPDLRTPVPKDLQLQLQLKRKP